MNNKHILEQIQDYIDGALSAQQKQIVEDHLTQCTSCKSEVDKLRKLISNLKALPKSIEPPADLFNNIEKTLAPKKILFLNPEKRINSESVTNFLKWFPVTKYARAAAILILVLGIGVTWYFIKQNSTDVQIAKVEQAVTNTPDVKSEDVARDREVGVNQKDSPKVNDKTILTGSSKVEKLNSKKDLAQKVTPEKQNSLLSAVTAKQDSTNLKIDSLQINPYKNGTAMISGKVFDKDTGEPLAGVNILLEGTIMGSSTDIDGIFTILNIPEGIYNLRVRYLGYKDIYVAGIMVKSGILNNLALNLETEVVQLHELTVSAERPLLSKDATATASGRVTTSEQVGALYIRGGREDELNIQCRQNQNFNTENYNSINENEFLDVLSNPLSTFSIDVDNASYSNVRRFINHGKLPPKDAVRIEEMINYFKYQYPQPEGKDPFSITTELSKCPWNKNNNLLLIGLQGKQIATDNLPPSNLVFLLDVSGSMDAPNKLPLVKAAFRLLVDQLREQDRVAIVVYAGRAGLVLPSTRGDEKEEILSAIDNLQAGGSTAGGQGISLAYKIAQEYFQKNGNNRVILATDGDFNVGASSDAEMERLIEEKRNLGIYLSVLGFGTGNYKDSKMETLADKGNGNYAYIDNLQEARKVFVSQMAGTLFTIAKDVKLQIEFNPVKVKAYRLIGYENRMLAKEDFNNDKKDAGELGSGHSVTALYEVVPSDGEIELPKVDDLKYQDSHIDREAKLTDEILTVKFRYKPPQDSTSKLIVHSLKDNIIDLDETSDNFRWAAAVAGYGMLLRDSKFKGKATYHSILDLAEDAKGKDREGYRSEFIRLVELSKALHK